MINVVKGRSSE